LEARYAVFFDALNEPWEYEKEGYVLEDGTLYLPDFWMPNLQCHLEIKGQLPTQEEYDKTQGLAHGTNKAAAIIHGLPGEQWGILYCVDDTDSSGGWGTWQFRFGVNASSELAFLVDQFDPERRILYSVPYEKILRTSYRWMETNALQHAATQAKEERFERRR